MLCHVLCSDWLALLQIIKMLKINVVPYSYADSDIVLFKAVCLLFDTVSNVNKKHYCFSKFSSGFSVPANQIDGNGIALYENECLIIFKFLVTCFKTSMTICHLTAS